MSSNKTVSAPRPRGDALRQAVVEAAERLLRQERAEFSMRDLATEARVSFATPFNQFGSKAAIMRALSDRRIDTMEARLRAAPPPGDAASRVLAATEIAAAVMLEEPAVNRAVMGWLGAPGPGGVWTRSAAFWRLAVADADGLGAPERAVRDLPPLLAFGFRGVLSFWTAGDLADAALAGHARDMARALLNGYGWDGG
ncbi:TetR/AcrR family transcriptional regulator [Acetobacteraceae bacterium KSS8]|uniref:TetR/AcrR family transcriptional regulator n=1 Tax=Endosaccharibacter trunci TaxID=2812733 RepID=A0ABT1W7V0_9PROT|nr:TetR/AcrR family transcriptional regulator [Acetobacteraceae bacterium KSS8]